MAVDRRGREGRGTNFENNNTACDVTLLYETSVALRETDRQTLTRFFDIARYVERRQNKNKVKK